MRRPAAGRSRSSTDSDDIRFGDFVQVARQGNPLFNEGLVAIQDKDLLQPHVARGRCQRCSRSTRSRRSWRRSSTRSSSAANVAPTTNRTDIAGIFIPDLIKVDLSTAPARLAGGGLTHPDESR